MDNLVKTITTLKAKFAQTYQGNSHIHEAIPLSSSDFLSIDENDLNMLHNFQDFSKNQLFFIEFFNSLNAVWTSLTADPSSKVLTSPIFSLLAIALSNLRIIFPLRVFGSLETK